MSANQSIKRNLSSMQVLKTLQLLLEGDYTMAELIEKLNKNEGANVFNNSVISKYINTCRSCGIEIPKIHNRYFVASIPFGLDLSTEDLDLLKILDDTIKETMSKNQNDIFDNFITKLGKYSNKHIMRVERNNVQETVDMFKNAVYESRKVILMFRAKALLECIPVEVIEKDGRTFLKVIFKDKERMISTERISGIQVLDQRFNEDDARGVVFKLTGGLAQRYTLRENEQVVTNNLPESITIVNGEEPKEVLFMRLLRYDKDCEVIHPLNFREEMKEIISDMLKNYGE